MRTSPCRNRAWLAGCALALATAPAHGQTAQAERTTEVRSQTTTTTQVRRLSSVIGAKLSLQGNTAYGQIEDIVLNDSGCVEYIVVAYEGRYSLIPYSAATVNYEQRTVSVNVTREKVQEVTFTRDNWSSLSDPQFTQRVRTVYGQAGGRNDREPPRAGQDDRNRPAAERDRPRQPGNQPERDRPRPQADPNRPGSDRDRPRQSNDPNRPTPDPDRPNTPAPGPRTDPVPSTTPDPSRPPQF